VLQAVFGSKEEIRKKHPVTLSSIRVDEWLVSDSGVHEKYEHWQVRGTRVFLEE